MAFLAPLMLWAIYGSLGLFVLFFLNRSIRAIGPVLVVMAATALFGANFALSFLTTDRGIAAAIKCDRDRHESFRSEFFVEGLPDWQVKAASSPGRP